MSMVEYLRNVTHAVRVSELSDAQLDELLRRELFVLTSAIYHAPLMRFAWVRAVPASAPNDDAELLALPYQCIVQFNELAEPAPINERTYLWSALSDLFPWHIVKVLFIIELFDEATITAIVIDDHERLERAIDRIVGRPSE